MNPAIRELVDRRAAEAGLDPNLVAAVVMVESSGDPDAYRYEPAFWLRYMAHKPEYRGKDPKAWSASYGLMQLMVTTAMQVGWHGRDPNELKIPSLNLYYGCKYLSGLIGFTRGDVERALAIYNGGVKGNGTRPFRNASYAAKVLRWRDKIAEQKKETSE